MLHPRTPLVALTSASWDVGLSLSLGWRGLYAESMLSTIPFPSTNVTTAIYARDAELIEPFFITVGTLPTEILELSTVRPWSRPRAPETPARRAKVHQVLVNPTSFIWLMVTLTAWPTEKVPL